MPEAERKDLDIALTATFTLLALIIGFSFSMAITRYDLRKTHEAAEAGAIATEYLRADFLPIPRRLNCASCSRPIPGSGFPFT